MLSYRDIKKHACQVGFDLCGVARVRVLDEHAARFERALEASGEGALGYLARSPERRRDPERLVEGAKTVVVCAEAYDGRAAVFDSALGGRVSAHRLGGEYQPRIRERLTAILERLRIENSDLGGRPFCDTAPILEKAWAVEAGLGWIGKNSLLVNPVFGSFLLLGELILDAECDRYDTPYSGRGCGGCRLCVDACPVGALVIPSFNETRGLSPRGGGGGESGSMVDSTVSDVSDWRRSFGGGPLISEVAAIDTRRCIASLTIERERKGLSVTPIHGWIRGCDECQTACPRN